MGSRPFTAMTMDDSRSLRVGAQTRDWAAPPYPGGKAGEVPSVYPAVTSTGAPVRPDPATSRSSDRNDEDTSTIAANGGCIQVSAYLSLSHKAVWRACWDAGDGM